MRFLRPFLLLLPAMLFWAGGCARYPARVESVKPLSERELLARLDSRAALWKDFQARIHIKAESSKGKFSLQSFVVAALPDRLRLEAFNLWGQTVAVLVLDQGKSRLYIPSEKSLYTSKHADRLIEYFLGIPLPLEAFAYSLVACVPSDHLDKTRFVSVPSGWNAVAKDVRDRWNITWQFLAEPAALQALEAREGSSRFSIRYDPAVGLDPSQVPGQILFSSPLWQMEVKVAQMKSIASPPTSSFGLPLPQGLRQVNLDQAR